MQPVRLGWLPGGRSFIQAMGLAWHPACFKCAECQQPISDPSFAARDGVAFHTPCHKKRYSSNARNLQTAMISKNQLPISLPPFYSPTKQNNVSRITTATASF
jgi:hypothetical protein